MFNEGLTEYQDFFRELPILRRVCFDGGGSSGGGDYGTNSAYYGGGPTMASRAASAYLGSASAASTQQAYSQYGSVSPYVSQALTTLGKDPGKVSSYSGLSAPLTSALTPLLAPSVAPTPSIQLSRVSNPSKSPPSSSDPFSGFTAKSGGPSLVSSQFGGYGKGFSTTAPSGVSSSSTTPFGSTYNFPGTKAPAPSITPASIPSTSLVGALSQTGAFGAPSHFMGSVYNSITGVGPNPFSSLISNATKAFTTFTQSKDSSMVPLAAATSLAVPVGASGVGLPTAALLTSAGFLGSFLLANRGNIIKAFSRPSVATIDIAYVPKYASQVDTTGVMSFPKVSSTSIGNTTSIPRLSVNTDTGILARYLSQTSTRSNVNTDTGINLRVNTFGAYIPPPPLVRPPTIDSDKPPRPPKPPVYDTEVVTTPLKSTYTFTGSYTEKEPEYWEEYPGYRRQKSPITPAEFSLGSFGGSGITTRKAQVKGPQSFWNTLGLAVYAPNPSLLGERKIVGGWLGKQDIKYGSKVSKSKQSGGDSYYSTPGVQKSIFSVI